MKRDWLMRPAWRSAVIVDTVPAGASFIWSDQWGWRYWRDGARIVTKAGETE